MSNEQSIGDPVPLSEYPFQHPNPGVVSAFNQCRAAETRITNELESSAQLTQIAKEKLRKDLYHVRLAGYLLVFSLSDTQTAAVTTSIVSAENVVALGAFYDQYFVRTCKISHFCDLWHLVLTSIIGTVRRTKSRTPQPSNHPSRPSFDLGADQLMDQGGLLPYPTTHSDAKKYVPAPLLCSFFRLHGYVFRLSVATTTAACSQARFTVPILNPFRLQRKRPFLTPGSMTPATQNVATSSLNRTTRTLVTRKRCLPYLLLRTHRMRLKPLLAYLCWERVAPPGDVWPSFYPD